MLMLIHKGKQNFKDINNNIVICVVKRALIALEERCAYDSKPKAGHLSL